MSDEIDIAKENVIAAARDLTKGKYHSNTYLGAVQESQIKYQYLKRKVDELDILLSEDKDETTR